MSRTRSLIHPLVAAALAVAVPGAALIATTSIAAAQPRKPVDKKKAAKDFTTAGLTAQDNGDYDTAVTMFGKAYELVPHPVLLFNMAQAQRLAGRTRAALDLYEQYVAAAPKTPQAKTAREFIIALDAQLIADQAQRQRDDAARADAARADAARPPAEQGTRPADLGPIAPAPPRRAAPADPRGEIRPNPDAISRPAPRARPGRGLRIGGLVTTGVGIAAVGVGLFYFGAEASRLADELSEPGTPFDPGKYDDGEAAERNMILATTAGGVLVVGGVVMYLVGRKQGATAERVTLVPALGPDRVGLVLAGRL